MQTALTGTFRQSPFWQLRALFRERGLLDSEVAAAVGMQPQLLSRRMRGVTPWLSSEICKICAALDIPQSDVGFYFFPEVATEEQHGQQRKKTPYLHIQIGADGNPEIELGGGRTEVMGLCAALMAGVTAMYGAGDPAAYLIGLMTAAAELLDRMEG